MDSPTTLPVSDGKGPPLTSVGEYPSAAGTCEVFTLGNGPLARTETYSLYVVQLPSGQLGLMKRSNPAGDSVLTHEAVVLSTLCSIAADMDREEVAAGRTPFGYGTFFPNLVEAVQVEDKRVVLFLGYHPEIASYAQLRPLSLLTRGSRVDLKSTVWILGKALKLMRFVHDCGYSIGLVDPSNLFLEPDLHGVFVLDFSGASDSITDAQRLEEVKAITRIAWNAAGGTDTSEPPHDPDIMSKEDHDKFVAFLSSVMDGDADIHGILMALYEMSDSIWPKVPVPADPSRLKRQFHPWKLYSTNATPIPA